MKKINIKINEINFLVYSNINTNKTILDVCIENGIYIPHFCYNKFLSIAGNCRICLIEINKIVKPIISCLNICIDNLSIYTNSFSIKKYRENVLEFLLINHPLDCPICDQAGECDLQEQTQNFGLSNSRFFYLKNSKHNMFLNTYIKLILNRCILCMRCVRYLNEFNQFRLLGVIGRGYLSKIGTYIESNMQFLNNSNIIDLCPVGALTLKLNQFSYRPWELDSIISIDFLDIFGSPVILNKIENKIIRILPQMDSLFNLEFISDLTRFNLSLYEKVLNFNTFSLYNSNRIINKTNILEVFEIPFFIFSNLLYYKNLILLNFYKFKKFINLNILKNLNMLNFFLNSFNLLNFNNSTYKINILKTNIKYMFKYYQFLYSNNIKYNNLNLINIEDINIYLKTKINYKKNNIIFQNNINKNYKNIKYLSKYLSFYKILLTFDDVLKFNYKNLKYKNINIYNFNKISYNILNKFNIKNINIFNTKFIYSLNENIYNILGINLINTTLNLDSFNLVHKSLFNYYSYTYIKNVRL